MRPDQHKKKASAAYKKKHGIKDPDKKTEKGGKNISTKGKQEAPSGKTPLKSSAPGDERKYVDLPEFESSDEEQAVNLRETASKETRGVVQPGKRFQKRQIVSNWTRYEQQQGEAAEDGKNLRGADYSQLLQSAGDALAQFRFRDEEDWETSEENQMFALDVNDLAQAVKCVPLPERLNIDSENFSPEMKKSFEESALKYSLLYGHPMDSEVDGEESPLKTRDNSTAESSHVPDVADVAGVNCGNKKDSDLVNEQTDGSQNVTLDNIVEGLLSKLKPSSTDSSHTQDTAKESTSSEQANSQSQENASTEPASDDLEDWLDSVI